MTADTAPQENLGHRGIIILFVLAVFMAATALFMVQPMVARMALPSLGGSPAVWTTTMLFFQTALLSGYLYAHLLSTRFSTQHQIVIHLGVLLIAATTLPIGLDRELIAAGESRPALALGTALLLGVGLPFFAISATAPLLQRWFSASPHRSAGDPYFLYAASNTGSFVGLLSYPVLIEPLAGITEQAMLWSTGYGLLSLLVAASGISLWRHLKPRGREREDLDAGAAPCWKTRLGWTTLSFAPSSLLLGVTTHITTDIAAMPLLWVVPFALYLLTFIAAFTPRFPLTLKTALRSQFLLLAMLAATFTALSSAWIAVPLHLATFTITSFICHAALAAIRPKPQHLTEYYLWISIGGMTGGLFNSLLAPTIFQSVAEYPLMLAVACLLRPRLDSTARPGRLDLATGGAILTLSALTGPVAQWLGGNEAAKAVQVTLVAALTVIPLGLAQPLRRDIAMACILVGLQISPSFQTVLSSSRNFFGVHTVTRSDNGEFHLLTYGTTLHGMQNREAEQTRRPLTYYSPPGPVGHIFDALDRTRHSRQRIAVAGLGTGSIACYANEGEDWTFYEIDPEIVRIAMDPDLFSYLATCTPKARIVVGDARIRIADEPNGKIDVLMLDAFSSDAIPVHLLTREALALYDGKMKPDGVLAIHISNRHLKLGPVAARLLQELGYQAIQWVHTPTAQDREQGDQMSHWILASRDAGFIEAARSDGDWTELKASAGAPLWTDSYSNILGILR